MGPLLLPLLQTTALTSSGIFAGYTWALSHAAIPSVLHATDPLLSAQWRTQYLAGFYISRPLCLLNGLTFGYLSYAAPVASPERTLYLLAALLASSGVPYALTVLRRTNGALSLRAHKVVGRERDDPIALTVSTLKSHASPSYVTFLSRYYTPFWAVGSQGSSTFCPRVTETMVLIF